MSALMLENFTFARGEHQIFDGLTLDIPAGTHQAVVGPSGCGKSTLLGLICGVLVPASGRILVDGQDLSSMTSPQRDSVRAKTIGAVFQNLGLASALSVTANLALAQRMAGQAPDGERASVLLERFGITHRAKAKPRQLSRGEAQRAAIARALVVRPKLLLADEPTASLDAQWRDKAMDVVFEEAEQAAMTVLVATHDEAVAQRCQARLTLPQGVQP